MEHFSETTFYRDPTPAAAVLKAREHTARPARTRLDYKQTRSTLTMNAIDLADIDDRQTTESLVALIELCEMLGRTEILVEGIEDSCGMTVIDLLDRIQRSANAACQSRNMARPRVALEKRRAHFDVRIYPVFH